MKRRTQRGRPHPALLAGAAGAALLGLLLLTGAKGKVPHQPIDFFHQVHSSERQIACAYCHRTAETADHAGMPSTRLCMSCHRAVIPDAPEIWKLRSYWELGESVPWAKVNELPAHVYFSHKAHTAAAKIDCAVCHGKMPTYTVVGQTESFSMGWCLECHRKQKASTECWACHR